MYMANVEHAPSVIGVYCVLNKRYDFTLRSRFILFMVKLSSSSDMYQLPVDGVATKTNAYLVLRRAASIGYVIGTYNGLLAMSPQSLRFEVIGTLVRVRVPEDLDILPGLPTAYKTKFKNGVLARQKRHK
jgi:hypothetical protein